jgi:hypothetical protein
MAVRLSALRTRCTLLPRNIIILMFLVLISVTGWVNPQGLVRPKWLGKFKKKITSSVIELATFQFVA